MAVSRAAACLAILVALLCGTATDAWVGGVRGVAAGGRWFCGPNGCAAGRRSLLDTTNKAAVDVVAANPDLSKLASLVSQLPDPFQQYLKDQAGDQFTVFAPNNAAWDALSKDPNDPKSADGLKEATIITALLSYHIVPGVAAKAADLQNGQKLMTALGDKVGPLTVQIQGESQQRDMPAGQNPQGGLQGQQPARNIVIQAVGSQAKVVQADIQFSRGVMHVIDAVLLPVPDKDAS